MSVTWNGSDITATSHLMLIYHDEIALDRGPQFSFPTSSPGALVCESPTQRGNWHYPNETLVDLVNVQGRIIQQIRSSYSSRLSRYVDNIQLTTAEYNGLWTCQLNGNVNGAVPVGIYHRGGSELQFIVSSMEAGSWGVLS